MFCRVGETRPRNQCRLCKVAFSTFDDLSQHITQWHGHPRGRSEGSKFLDDSISTDPPERPKSGINEKLAGSSNNMLKESEDLRSKYVHIKKWLSYYENLRSSRVLTSTIGKTNPATKRNYEVPGNLNGAQVTAFPDTGAEENVISLDFAVRNKIDIQYDSQLEFQLPTGKVSQSVGTTYLPWRFADEPKVFNISFSVLPECTHDVILGGKFLKFTQTFTKFAHRVKMKLLPFAHRVKTKLLPFAHRAKTKLLPFARVITNAIGKINPATKRHYEVPGNLNGARVMAFLDTGAEESVISLDFAVRNKLDLQRDSQLKFQLPTGKVSRSVGTAYLPWQFANEPKVFKILFSVLPECTHDVIIGRKFLKFTQTLTKFVHRIKTKLLPFRPRLGVKLLGSQRQRVRGSLDGERVVAVPDTGSDVMLVSTAYAKQRGFRIFGQNNCRSELEFADGSRAFTRGLVKDVDWSFDGSDISYQCDFHVLDNLPVDVVLSNDFLFDVNAFSEYGSSFFEDDVSAEGYVELSLIRQISWLSNRIQKALGRGAQEGTHKISRYLTLDILLM